MKCAHAPATTHGKLGRLFGDLVHPVFGLADHDGGGQSHAPLSGGSEGSANQLIDGVLLVGISHDDTVVLGAHVALDALPVGGAAVENVVAGLVSALNKGNTDYQHENSFLLVLICRRGSSYRRKRLRGCRDDHR